MGQMVGGADRPDRVPPEVKATGWKASVRKGWRGLRRGQVVAYQPDATRELRVGVVVYNDSSKDCVELHSCKPMWTGMNIIHKKEYRLTVAEGALIVTEPAEEAVKCMIFYRALVKVVELYVDGRMFQGDASALSKGGWAFKVDEHERVRAISSALLTSRKIMNGEGISDFQGKETVFLMESNAKEIHSRSHLSLPRDKVRRSSAWTMKCIR